jgi:rubrerythrin
MSIRLDFSRLNLMDALDLASLIEVEARDRYVEFAESLGTRGEGDAGAVFRSMAENETKHCNEIAERRLALFGDQRARVTLDDIFDVRALFEELRDEETEHVNMLVKIIANLPKSAEVELEDEDYDENRPARDSFEV